MSDTPNQLNTQHKKLKNENDHNAIAEKIYDDLIKSICIDVAAGVHKMAKSGNISLTNAVETSIDNKHGSSNKRRRIRGISDYRAPPNEGKGHEDGKKDNEMRLRTRGATSGVDAWGRIPPKDVLTTCKVCSKNMSATRFAAHLDKCLGIGNSRGGHSSRSAK